MDIGWWHLPPVDAGIGQGQLSTQLSPFPTEVANGRYEGMGCQPRASASLNRYGENPGRDAPPRTIGQLWRDGASTYPRTRDPPIDRLGGSRGTHLAREAARTRPAARHRGDSTAISASAQNKQPGRTEPGRHIDRYAGNRA